MFCENQKQASIDAAMKIWEEHAILREGYRDYVYLDTLGKPTAGIGHLITKKDGLKVGEKVSPDLIKKWFIEDSKKSLNTSIKQSYELKQFIDPYKYNAEFLAALVSVNYQLGDWSTVFKSSYPLLVKGQWQTVIENLRESLWYRQTPVRVNDFIKAIKDAYS